MVGPPVIDCPFMAAATDGSGLVVRHLRRYALRHPGVESPAGRKARQRHVGRDRVIGPAAVTSRRRSAGA
jgi:hypothetical protein